MANGFRVLVALLLLGLGLCLILGQKPEVPVEPEETEERVEVPAYRASEYEQEVIRLTNIERTSRGLRALSVTEPLMKDAKHWSGVQASRSKMYHSKMGHGENVAYGQRTPQSVMQAWMTSPGHRRNILNSRYTQLGVGAVSNGRSIYWTQVFE
jgi:uncharacterized protein YkwD